MKLRTIIAVAAMASIPTFALAQGARASLKAADAKGDTLTMNCVQARGAVKGSGGVLLQTGANHFDLYHRKDGTCEREGDDLQPAFVRTKDTALCFIGYTCEAKEVE